MGLIDNININVGGNGNVIDTLSTYVTKVLKPNIINCKNILSQDMMPIDTGANTKYVIKYDYELSEDITIPENCILEFDGGSLGNGTIVFNNTTLQGNVKCFCNIEGTITNTTVNISWFNLKDVNILKNVFSCLLSEFNNVFLVIDVNIVGDNSTVDVDHVYLKGNDSIINNSFRFNAQADIKVSGITFNITNTQSYLFHTAGNVNLKNISVDGGNKLGYCIYVDNENDIVNISVSECEFTKVLNVVLYAKSRGVAYISRNIIHDIGSDANVVGGIYLGYTSSKLEFNDSIISDNIIKNIKCRYSDTHNSREAHGIIVYGHRNNICHNIIDTIYSNREDTDTGYDAEGLYIKGGYTTIEGNYIKDAAGILSDASITLKGSGEYNHIMYNTVISQNCIGIVSYKGHTYINNNYIEVKTSAIYLASDGNLNMSGSYIANNEIRFTGEYSNTINFTAIIIYLQKDVNVYNNNIIGFTEAIKCSGASNIRFFSNETFLENVSFANSTIGVNYLRVENSNNMQFYDNIFDFRGVNFYAYYFLYNSVTTLFKGNIIKLKDYIGDETVHCFSNRLIRSSNIIIENNIFEIDSPLTLVGSESPNIIIRNNLFKATTFPFMTCIIYGNRLYDDIYIGAVRPIVVETGAVFYDTTLGYPIYWNGTKWVEEGGATAGVARSGAFANKPAATDIYVGFRYFCTDKQTTEGSTDGIEIIHKGNDVWVDALGRVVS